MYTNDYSVTWIKKCAKKDIELRSSSPQGETTRPDNRVTPGESRKITVAMPSDGWLKFCAGRNGMNIECKKKTTDPGYSGYTYTVTYGNSNPFSHRKLLIKVGLQ
jgi:hypothetical protein